MYAKQVDLFNGDELVCHARKMLEPAIQVAREQHSLKAGTKLTALCLRGCTKINVWKACRTIKHESASH